MALLSKLKTANITRKTAGPINDPMQRVRSKFITALEQQKASVEAAEKNEKYTITRKKGGQEVESRFRPWWFRSGDTYYTEVRYGTGQIKINDGTAIEAGKDLGSLKAVYVLLEDATKAGELDAELNRFTQRVGRGERANKGAEEAPAPRGRGRRAG